jgi:glycosyltransferase involved in cell wall biosynthesis
VPDVSVIIPTRDRYAHLSLTLRSVTWQRGVDLEVIVVDDGSVDDTETNVSRLGDPRIRVVRNDVPLGESGARNRGIEQAAGRWVAFLDDDDLWAPDKLALQLDAVRRAAAGWAYAGDVVVDDGLNILYGSPPPPPSQVVRDLDRHNSVPAGASNVLVDASLLFRAGSFDVRLRRTADWDMWLRLSRLGVPVVVQRPLVANRVHPGNMSRDMRLLTSELDVIAERYGIRVDRARHFRWAAWTSLIEGHRREAVGYYARASLAGDLPSVGRATLAILDRNYATRTLERSRRDAGLGEWADRARTWLTALSAQDAHERPTSST